MSTPNDLRFSLVDSTGTPVDEDVARGAFSLFFFGFTHCATVCPRALAKLSASVDALGKDADAFRPFYVTVDPDRDDPETLRAYLSARHPRFTGLTGDPEELAALRKDLRVFAVRRPDPQSPGGYSVPHSAFAYAFSPDLEFIEPLGDALTAAEVTARLRTILSRSAPAA